MLKQILISHHVPASANYLVRTISTKWDLLSSVCVERHPIITKAKNELENKYQELLWSLELEKSMKSDHEVRVEFEKNQMNLQKNAAVDVDFELLANQTAQDLEDQWKDEFAQLKLAPRITEFDSNNIVTSVKRKLDQNLLLLTQQKVGNESFWIPPQGIRQEGETMRQTAERVLKEICGTELSVMFYGNAPIGFYKYQYPKSIKKENGPHGAKIFYFLAKYIDGDISNNTKYQWLDQSELENIVPVEMYKSVSKFLL